MASSKINGVDSGRPAGIGAGAGPARPQGTGQAAPGASPPGADAGTIHITDVASQLAALEQTLRDLPAVDEARVAATRSSIDQGTYTISPQRIADQLIRLEQSLGNLPNGDEPQQPPPNP